MLFSSISPWELNFTGLVWQQNFLCSLAYYFSWTYYVNPKPLCPVMRLLNFKVSIRHNKIKSFLRLKSSMTISLKCDNCPTDPDELTKLLLEMFVSYVWLWDDKINISKKILLLKICQFCLKKLHQTLSFGESNFILSRVVSLGPHYPFPWGA